MEAGSRRGLGVGRGLLGCAAAAGILLILLCRQPRPASTPFTLNSEHPPTIPKKRIFQLPQGCVGIEDASALVQPSVSPTPSASPAMGQPIEGLGGFCDPIYTPNRVAHAIVYDMSEPEDKWPLRNAQFLRVFKGLRDTGSKADLVLIVPGGTKQQLDLLTHELTSVNVKIIVMDLPFEEGDLTKKHAEWLRKNPNCCGWREFYKLVAWKLVQYDRVMLLDSDLQIVGNVEHLLRCEQHKFLATPGFFSPLNGGLWVLTPSLCTYHDMLELVLAGNYGNRGHWGGLGIESLHVGAEGPQGFLYYYFYILQPKLGSSFHRGLGRYIDKCIYNANLNFCTTSNVIGNKIYIVHKPTDDVPKVWLNRFLEAVGNITDAARPQLRASLLLPKSLGKNKVHVVHVPGVRSLFVHCNLVDRLLIDDGTAQLDDVVDQYGWPYHARDSPRYAVLLQKPYHWVMDALERRDAIAIGATGAFGHKVVSGEATVQDYLAASDNEILLNPMTALLASASRKVVGRNHATRNDFKIAISRIHSLEMIVTLADRPAESLMLLSHELGLNITAASQCQVQSPNDPLEWDRENGPKSEMMAVNNRHSLDFNLYLTARRIFRRQFYHAFGLVLARFEESGASLECTDTDIAACDTDNNREPPQLTPHLKKRVEAGAEVLCQRRCNLVRGDLESIQRELESLNQT
eukprot:m.68466 g.68466  ORF g.68466 m.68466 type:complete len:688 (-) comp9923_c0_seq1:30-2093(-)